MNRYGLGVLLAAGYNDQGLALIVAAIAVACFTVVFTILFVSYRKFAVAEIDSGKRDIELIELYFHDRKKSVMRWKKILKAVKFLLYTLLMAFITFCLVFTAFVRFSSEIPFGTKSFMVVATGSMSEKYKDNTYLFSENLNDQFPQRCIIIIEKVSESDLKQYDVVAYKHPSGATYIHRIRRIDVDESGNTTYYTRGDANKDDDQVDSCFANRDTTYDDIIGKYTGVYIPYLGAFVLFLQSYAGIVTVAALIFCLIMFDKNTGNISDAQEKRTEYLVKALDIKDIHEDSEITVDFVEKIYLDKVGYLVHQDGALTKSNSQDSALGSETVQVSEQPSASNVTEESETTEKLKESEE